MKEYLLFVDTEASGLPKNWDLPYTEKDNWPYCVQVAWIIYTNKGQKVKQENHYIKDKDFEISKSSIEIHGITRDFLTANGDNRKEIFKCLADDIDRYDPLIIGHFMEFDGHMLSADFFRAGIDNPIKKEQTFCTMVGTSHLVQNPYLKYFRLGDLYAFLFNSTLKNQHNALVDATATAACFFELQKRGEVTDEKIALQQEKTAKKDTKNNNSGCLIPLIVIIITLTLLIYKHV